MDHLYTIIDPLDDEDDRTWGERVGDVVFPAVMWTLIASVVLGVSGLCFFVGAWGFHNGIALFQT